MNKRRTPSGFTLIEVLIALLVLAIGALGAGSLILQARRAGQQSSLMSAAVHLATMAADAMRANAFASAAADGDNPYLQLDYDVLANGPPGDAAGCSVMACDSTALAAADLAMLRRSLFDHFPLGRIKICRDGAAFDHTANTLRWQCDGASGVPAVIKIGWRQRVAESGAAAGDAPVMLALPLPPASRAHGGVP